jgi:hypothetical protein
MWFPAWKSGLCDEVDMTPGRGDAHLWYVVGTCSVIRESTRGYVELQLASYLNSDSIQALELLVGRPMPWFLFSWSVCS